MECQKELQKQTTTSCKCAEQQFIITELKNFAKVTKQNHLERTKSAMPQTDVTVLIKRKNPTKKDMFILFAKIERFNLIETSI